MDLAAIAADICIWRVKRLMPAKIWLLGRQFTFKPWVRFNAPIAIYHARWSIHNSKCPDWIIKIWKQTKVLTLFVCPKWNYVRNCSAKWCFVVSYLRSLPTVLMGSRSWGKGVAPWHRCFRPVRASVRVKAKRGRDPKITNLISARA